MTWLGSAQPLLDGLRKLAECGSGTPAIYRDPEPDSEPEPLCCPACDGKIPEDGKCKKCGAAWPKPGEGVEAEHATQGSEDLTQGVLHDLHEEPIKAGEAGNAPVTLDLRSLPPASAEPYGRSPDRQLSDWADTMRRDQMRSQLWGDAARYGGMALGAGAAWRGLQGLGGLFHRRKKRDKTEEVVLPAKTAETIVPPSVPPVPDPVHSPTAYTLHGFGAKSPMGLPEAVPLLGAAIAGGAVLGNKGVDWLMARRRKKELDANLERQKARYQAAMQKISSDLDLIYDTLQSPVEAGRVEEVVKSAVEIPGSVLGVGHDNAGKILGLLTAAGGLAALGAHNMTYNYMKRREPSAVLSKALEQQKRQRFALNPVVPVSVATPEEEEMEPVPKGRPPRS